MRRNMFFILLILIWIMFVSPVGRASQPFSGVGKAYMSYGLKRADNVAVILWANMLVAAPNDLQLTVLLYRQS